MTDREELLAYIALIRNRPYNTMEQWNLMIDAERKLEQAVTVRYRPLVQQISTFNPPDHNGGWEPPLG